MTTEEMKNAEKLFLRDKHKKGYDIFYQLKIKRVIAITACCAALPIVLIITIPVSIAIKLEDNGPVFYRSMRIGKESILLSS